MEPQQLCPFCNQPITDTFYFCPQCGKNLKPIPISTSIPKQIGIYALSIFLPPLGLWPGIKYVRQSNEKAKIVGIIAIVLTIISTVLTIWLTLGLVSQVGQYQTLGL